MEQTSNNKNTMRAVKATFTEDDPIMVNGVYNLLGHKKYMRSVIEACRDCRIAIDHLGQEKIPNIIITESDCKTKTIYTYFSGYQLVWDQELTDIGYVDLTPPLKKPSDRTFNDLANKRLIFRQRVLTGDLLTLLISVFGDSIVSQEWKTDFDELIDKVKNFITYNPHERVKSVSDYVGVFVELFENSGMDLEIVDRFLVKLLLALKNFLEYKVRQEFENDEEKLLQLIGLAPCHLAFMDVAKKVKKAMEDISVEAIQANNKLNQIRERARLAREEVEKGRRLQLANTKAALTGMKRPLAQITQSGEGGKDEPITKGDSGKDEPPQKKMKTIQIEQVEEAKEGSKQESEKNTPVKPPQDTVD